MGNCIITYDEIRFDVRRHDTTEVYVLVSGKGDCPHQALGWHRKEFPGEMSTQEIHSVLFTQAEYNPIYWERGTPPVPKPLTYAEATVWTRIIQSLAMPPSVAGAAEKEMIDLFNSRLA